MKSELFKTAWQFVKITGKSFSECLRKAWANFKLKSAMQKGIVKFYFQKVDGSIREAYGTLKAERISVLGVEVYRFICICPEH